MEDVPDLGPAVQQARQRSGLTLEQVSARTRIRPGLLRDLERGVTDRCGGTVYARGHLKAVARVTGSDPAPLLAALARTGPDALEDDGPVAAVGGGRTPAPGGRTLARRGRAAHPRTTPGSEGDPAPQLVLPSPPREPRRPSWGVVAAAAVGLLAVLSLVELGHRAAPPPVAAPALSPRPAATPVAPATPAVPATPLPPTTPPAAPVAAVEVHVGKGPSWVSVSAAGGASLFRGIIPAGGSRSFSGSARLQVVVGGPGDIRVACAGAPVAPAASHGVRHYTCVPGGSGPV